MKRPLIAVLCLLVVSALGSRIPRNAHADMSLATFLLQRESSLQAADPAVSTQCFSIYLPQLQNAADQWAADYNVCINNATAERSTLMQEMGSEQTSLNASATGVCAYVDNCQTISDPLDFFDCFADFAPTQINTVYAISADASENAVDLRQQLAQIDIEMYKCTNATERTYVETTASLYDELDDCLKYGPTGSSSTSSSTAPPTTMTTASSTESSTNPPTTTITAPTTSSTAPPTTRTTSSTAPPTTTTTDSTTSSTTPATTTTTTAATTTSSTNPPTTTTPASNNFILL